MAICVKCERRYHSYESLNSEGLGPCCRTEQKRFTLDGDSIPDLGRFVADNDLEPETVNDIGRLAVGEELVMGGGAAPIFVLKRVR
jgi:hypothetical protein